MFKPMLASPADFKTLTFPKLASPKLDGVRAIVRGGVVYSRSNKLIPNQAVQRKFSLCEGFDGELIVGSPYAEDVYRRTVSTVMRQCESADDVRFYVFDSVVFPEHNYTRRRAHLITFMENRSSLTGVTLLEQQAIANLDQLYLYEDMCLNKGYEGLILRSANTSYKFGRSTTREQKMLKVKRFVDAEAVVVGFQERMHNANEAMTNELGRTARSSHQENQIGRGDLGALLCVTPEGVEFSIGTGFSDADREHIWDNRGAYQGCLAKYKYFPIGGKDAPRHPVFLGWRALIDL